MDNTYIIYDAAFMQMAKVVEEQLGVKSLSYIAYNKESETHNWLTREFNSSNIERLIIPLSIQSNDTEGLLIALHVRLNYELPVEKRTIPIIIISNLSVENIITKSYFDTDNNPQILLFTQGVSVSSTDIEEIKEKIEVTPSLNGSVYPQFLKSLSINRKALYGHHDMANAWGCYKLSQVVGYNLSSPQIKDYLGQMYAKWLICTNNTFESKGNPSIIASPILCKGKRVLYIDDKADEGWGELMKYIFKDAEDGFVYIDPCKYKQPNFDFDSFYNECSSYIGQRWDLIIVDLRLNPSVEDVDSTEIIPTELSGYKLIDDFLNYNAGYQIMVFTASNKIWNVDAAIQRGACGYFIKESPNFNPSIEESKKSYEDNFKLMVNRCFKRCYLFDIYEKLYEYGKNLPKDKFGNELYTQLDIAFELLCFAKTKEQYGFAYVSLYMVIEIINNYLIDKNGWILPNGDTMHKFEYDSRARIFIDKGEYTDFSNPSRHKMIASLILQVWKLSKGQLLAKKLYDFIQRRDAFVHKDSAKLAEYSDMQSEKAFIDLFDTLHNIIPIFFIH